MSCLVGATVAPSAVSPSMCSTFTVVTVTGTVVTVLSASAIVLSVSSEIEKLCCTSSYEVGYSPT